MSRGNPFNKTIKAFCLVACILATGCASSKIECNSRIGCRKTTKLMTLAGAEELVVQKLPNGVLFIGYLCNGGGSAKSKITIFLDEKGRKIDTYRDINGTMFDTHISYDGDCGRINVIPIVSATLGFEPPQQGLPGQAGSGWGRTQRSGQHPQGPYRDIGSIGDVARRIFHGLGF